MTRIHSKQMSYILIFFCCLFTLSSCSPLSADQKNFSKQASVNTHIKLGKQYGIYQGKYSNLLAKTVAKTLDKSCKYLPGELQNKIQKNKNSQLWSISILDTEKVTAFSTTNGFIYISKGALQALGSEDELAAIIAHEMFHSILQHSCEKTSIINNTCFSKSQETDADLHAIKLLTISNYNPLALVTALDSLYRENKTNVSQLADMHISGRKQEINMELIRINHHSFRFKTRSRLFKQMKSEVFVSR